MTTPSLPDVLAIAIAFLNDHQVIDDIAAAKATRTLEAIIAATAAKVVRDAKKARKGKRRGER